tara:strand:+ start:898 stop:1212 length:315 start_codon:yes stop_codon:yes gene_type:complete
MTHEEIIKTQQELSRILNSLKEKGYIIGSVQFDEETKKVTVQVTPLFKPDFIDVNFTIEKENKESEEWPTRWWLKEPTPPPVQQIKLHGCELCGNLTCRGTCFK